MGWIIMEFEDMLFMFGFNLMCVVMVFLEMEILLMIEFVIWLILEVFGGLVEVEVKCCECCVESVVVHNVLSFYDWLDVMIEVEGLGILMVDIVYGGDIFVIVDVEQLGFEVVFDEVVDIV